MTGCLAVLLQLVLESVKSDFLGNTGRIFQPCPFCNSVATFCWFAPTKRLTLTALFEPVEWCWPGLMTQMEVPGNGGHSKFTKELGSGY